MKGTISVPALHLMRLPGDAGPILRCAGELSVATVEALRREMALMLSLGYPALILNLSGCASLDPEATMTVLQTRKELDEEGRRLAIVTGTGPVFQVFQQLGALEEFPLFATEAVAKDALRGGVSPREERATGAWVECLTERMSEGGATASPGDLK